MDISLTVGVPGEDIDGATFDRLALYAEQKAPMGIIAMVTLTSSSIYRHYRLLSKRRKGRALQKVHQNISESSRWRTKGKSHFIYGVSVYKNRLELTPMNILGRALQYRKYRVKNPVSLSFRGCLRLMLASGQYMPGCKWLSMLHMSRLRAELLWKSCIAHELVSISDVDHVYFGTTDSPQYFQENKNPFVYPDVKQQANKHEDLSNLKPTIDQQSDHGRHQDCNLKPEVKEEDVLADPEPHSDDGEDDFDIIELEKVLLPGDDVDNVLSDLLIDGYNIATNPRITAPTVGQNAAVQIGSAGAGSGQTHQSEEEIPPIDLEDLETVAADIELLLSDLQFAGYKLESKRKTTAMDVTDVEPLPEYIPLCRSSAAGYLQKQRKRK
ncbi:hypothetical protein R1sor_004808 [Riccia sorocarpa]|uniref:Uncharacterized protein n=1 Tax=Riccia sorocarpa TaxID=122646 RepID=A0ABD3HI12_9MARC